MSLERAWRGEAKGGEGREGEVERGGERKVGEVEDEVREGEGKVEKKGKVKRKLKAREGKFKGGGAWDEGKGRKTERAKDVGNVKEIEIEEEMTAV